MIAKHIPMHAVKKSGFTSLVRNLTDTEGNRSGRATLGDQLHRRQRRNGDNGSPQYAGDEHAVTG